MKELILREMLALIDKVENKELALSDFLVRAPVLLQSAEVSVAQYDHLQCKLNELDDEYAIAMSQIFSSEFDISLNHDVLERLRALRSAMTDEPKWSELNGSVTN